MKNCDVVVVGGGPVGLWTACELSLAGLAVVLVERRTEPMVQSRALTIHGRTLELFAMRGIADCFLSEGKPIPTGHFAALDTRLDFSVFETRFPFTLFLPQSRTEALLEQYATELGVTILRGHMVESVTGAIDHGYTVAGTGPQGGFAIECRAVVGADARRSIVREAAGISFDGHDASLSIMMGDVRMNALDGPPVSMFCNARGGGMIAPVSPDGRMRIILVDPQRSHVAVNESLPLSELQASARRILGRDLGIRDPSWLTRFGNETRLASSYRQGYLFVAGDAAHIHAPTGGQGMNVGLQDAMNLGWKLATVLKGQAPNALLDSYEAERRPVGAQLARNTMTQIAMMTNFDPAHLELRSLMSELLNIPELNRRLAGEVSGFDISYPENTLPEVTAATAGQRVPDMLVKLQDGSQVSTHALLADGKWLHLSFSEGAEVEMPQWLPGEAVRRILCKAAPEQDEAITAMLIRPDGYSAGACTR